ncbi:MAG: 5-(carboxyamino)imidazole ribonucleotide mutase [Spirochaetia bacterium]|nr:5-(carboxyamino)imidazole ribonucleotide mutase [Spirochaetia bacterium]
MSKNKKIAILMGSQSDYETMKSASDILTDFGIEHEVKILSAHRTPEEVKNYVESAPEKGICLFIAGAGMAAHLAGVIASHTTLPVFGVPMESGALKGFDALLSTVQMPGGIPVGTLGIGSAGAKNAALLAVSVFSIDDQELETKLKAYRKKQAEKVLSQNK